MNTLIGRKIDQTQKFLENGKRVPVTLISAADNSVLQVKTLEKDGYKAAQLGFGVKKKANKALTGHSKKAGFDKVVDYVKEVRLEEGDNLSVGEYVTLGTIFKPGDKISVTGVSKGKGFAGVVKRHGFRGGPKTHGQSDRERAPGSIGQTTTPGRVYRGKRMAGRMGSDTVTVSNLTIISIDLVKKILMVSGLVPGSRDSIVIVTKTGEQKKFVPLLDDAEKSKAEEAAKKAEEEAAIKEAEEEAKKTEAAVAAVEGEQNAEEKKAEAEAKPEVKESSDAKAMDDKEKKK